jgi:ketosteroid isomerase-like protein
VGDVGLPLESPGALQLDLLGSQALEQTSPLADEDGDEMER